ncbi:MAG: N-acetylmuramoyl-L-alanine amidase, partial [Bacteroidetes bacterium]|nr:N-acetylmuramoyl-L-alanine amidase [Bacteroidota bacterium]
EKMELIYKNKGKLFVSIHLNSAATKPGTANGFETYILRPGRNDDAVRVANFENSVIKLEKKTEKYKRLTEEELIIATMAQSAFVKFSELFARTLQSEVEKTTAMKNRGVNQAGFYVLVGASMPNVLFEAAFLSNQSDEDYVNSVDGINAIAQGIFNAISRYAEEYERLCK